MHIIKKFLIFNTALFVGQVVYASSQEKRLAVIIPSYCNAEWYQKNLESLLSQEYENWYAIYIDDCSSDGTATLVAQYIKDHGLEDKIFLIANEQRRGALANHYIATHLCNDWDIVVQYDGDDWFPHNRVLAMINEYYDDSDVWFTYGSFEDWPTNARGYSKPVSQKVVDDALYRETYWAPGQLRTFYAWLFKKIKLEDLLWDHQDAWQGRFYPASYDLAICYPMMEMAGKHFKYVDDIIYIHNVQNALNDFKVNRIPQIIASNILLYKKKYDPLKTPPARTTAQFKGADVVILSHNGLNGCEQTIASCQQYLEGVKQIVVVDVMNNTAGIVQENGIVARPSPLRAMADGARRSFNEGGYKNIKQALVSELNNWWKTAPYVLLITNGMLLQERCNLQEWANMLDATYAFAFFPALGVDTTTDYPAAPLLDDLFAWKLCYANQTWLTGSSQLCVFGHKQKIRERIAYLTSDLIERVFLKDLFADGMLMIKDTTISRIGLSYKTPRIA